MDWIQGSSIKHQLSTFNLQPSTFNLQLSTFNVQLSTFNLQPSTFNLQPSTFNLQPSTFNLQPSTFNLQPSTFNLQPSTFNLQCSTFTTMATHSYEDLELEQWAFEHRLFYEAHRKGQVPGHLHVLQQFSEQFDCSIMVRDIKAETVVSTIYDCDAFPLKFELSTDPLMPCMKITPCINSRPPQKSNSAYLEKFKNERITAVFSVTRDVDHETNALKGR